MDKIIDFVVIGGGAAGIFGAIIRKEKHPSSSVILLEKSAVLLSKVKISGGGRCNVTHNCFDPMQLTQNYPRGNKELRGPFHHFQPKDMILWLESKGVQLKTETDGRMFPITDRSETIIDCLLQEAATLGVEIRIRQRITHLLKKEDHFEIKIENYESLLAKKVLLATGNSADGHKWAESLGHTIQPPVPSLFTFNVPTSPLKSLSGIAVENVELRIDQTHLIQKGVLLITHFGFSGPAALKLSAWGARYLHERNYQVDLNINWTPQYSEEEIIKIVSEIKSKTPQRTLLSENLFEIPKNLWKFFLEQLSESFKKRMHDLPLKDIRALAQKLHKDTYKVEGKTTHKEEFVTCGGVSLKEIDFKTMESKICPNLFFAGEILDIDGVTGGFNFQNAWTTAFLAGSSPMNLS